MLAPGFDTNDDAVINMIVAGEGFGLAPDEHMVFTHVWIGLVLKTAYTHFPDVPWYASYLLAVQAAANVVLLYCTIATGLHAVAAAVVSVVLRDRRIVLHS